MSARAIKIAITAMGGQGGGVLANWIVQLGEKSGFVAQMTSVPGVAQRTGTTVYYVELFPVGAAQEVGKPPVLALMPAPGDVDIVIAAELMEAGRAVKRGFVTEETTLIASTHRDYAISEKIGLGDARRDAEQVLCIAEEAAGNFIGADMAAAAAEAGTVISSVLFGALAGAQALPIDRGQFEEVICQMGRAVDANLRGFARGYDIASGSRQIVAKEASDVAEVVAPSPTVAPLIERMRRVFPAVTHYFIREGLKRTVDFQDVRYADEYLDRLETVLKVDTANDGEQRDFQLTQAVAKHLALWMTFEDTIRVADLKTRKSRFSRFRDDVRAEESQIVEVREYMHPRVEEICDILPTPLAKFILGNNALRKVFKFFLGDGRRVSTTSLRGYLPLYLIGSLRPIRPASYRYHVEQKRITDWLSSVTAEAETNYWLGVSIAKMQRLIKGYGETHERGLSNFAKVAAALPVVKELSDPAGEVSKLINSALKDEEGTALRVALDALNAPRVQAT